MGSSWSPFVGVLTLSVTVLSALLVLTAALASPEEPLRQLYFRAGAIGVLVCFLLRFAYLTMK